jgi:hypothetical protein
MSLFKLILAINGKIGYLDFVRSISEKRPVFSQRLVLYASGWPG